MLNIYWRLGDLIHTRRRQLARIFRGYADMDWFSYYHVNSARAVKLLTLLLEKGHGGCPGAWGCEKCLAYSGKPDTPSPWDCECKPFERWNDALRDMIFFHKVCAGDYEEGEIDTLDLILKKALFQTGTIFQSHEDARRYRRGAYYYHRWYRALWD